MTNSQRYLYNRAVETLFRDIESLETPQRRAWLNRIAFLPGTNPAEIAFEQAIRLGREDLAERAMALLD